MGGLLRNLFAGFLGPATLVSSRIDGGDGVEIHFAGSDCGVAIGGSLCQLGIDFDWWGADFMAVDVVSGEIFLHRGRPD